MTATAPTPPDTRPSPGGEPVAEVLHGLADKVFGGEAPLRITAWDGSTAGPADAPALHVTTPQALTRLLYHPGELGLAQAYVLGEIDVEGDLLDGLRRVWAATRERGLSSRLDVTTVAAGLRAVVGLKVLRRPPAPPATQAQLRGRLHSKRRDSEAISHHYDLSNEFYDFILDRHKAYSCAYYTSDDPSYTLEDAQRDKLDLVCRKLGLDQAKPGHRHLDIGCGWGSLSLHAAAAYGVDVVGVTISKEQKASIDERLVREGLQGKVDIRLQDYREVVDGPFDTVSSIEMGEHVGKRNYPVFLGQIERLLAPGGRMLIQQMSRVTKPGGGPFIEAFIAPDMHMRPVGETIGLIEEAGLEVRDVHALREHYVRTVDAWYATFESNWDRVVAMVGEEMARVWRLYLVGGALAFEEGRMGVDQILAVKATPDGRSGLPPVRAW
ncbi:class I SAM-dependent methyltransferase [Nocardioides sp. HDW12B]|uniref:SAM-dependent methyltransferase n=1 Tax=Nocardioides sp. HDW12B TaxID=2714939 RepID=UPI00140C2020|nr:cyclopropane-fatty-acyl-phospholipid synthase family protein [Nocardioides sp. HDW12B]QIK66389.1 class I SAM-dependent methyltransferase [Nocardioides sp. HDW12B]